MARLGNYVKIKTGKLDANASCVNGKYPFFTCSVKPLRIDSYSYDCECVLVAGNGDLNVKYYNGKFDAYQRTYIIESIDKKVISVPYISCFLDKYVETLRKQSIGGVIKYIKLENLTEAQIPLLDIKTQNEIVRNLKKVNELIKDTQEQQIKLDELVKSRFIELFGDLASPDCKWETRKLVETCVAADDIKCGPFGTQLSKDEYVDSGVAVWEIPQINSLFATLPTHYLTEEKAKELDAYSIKAGDIAMSRKGNVGKCAVFPISFASGIIHSDVLRIRVDGSQVLPLFMMHQLHYSGSVQHQIELVSAGAIMAGINVTKLKQIFVHIPPMHLQQQFAAFVAQVDKSKFVA